VTRLFGALAVSTYYWFRLPALIGFGVYPGDGTLVDLRGSVGPWLPALLQCAAVLVLTWWLLDPGRLRRPWSIRPELDK